MLGNQLQKPAVAIYSKILLLLLAPDEQAAAAVLPWD